MSANHSTNGVRAVSAASKPPDAELVKAINAAMEVSGVPVVRSILGRHGVKRASEVAPEVRQAVLAAMSEAASKTALDDRKVVLLLGRGVDNPVGERRVVALRDLQATLEGHTGEGAWCLVGEFVGNHRKNEAWQSSDGITLDVDRVVKTEEPLSDAERTVLGEVLRALKVKGLAPTDAYETRRGLRLLYVLRESCSDATRHKAAATALCNKVDDALRGSGFEVDRGPSTDRSHLMFTPRATVRGRTRQGRVVRIGGLIDINELACDSPAPVDAARDRVVVQIPAAHDESKLNEITAKVQQLRTGPDMLAGNWRRLGFKSSSECHYALTKEALRAVGMRRDIEDRRLEELVLDWLMELPVWSDGAVDSPNARKYTNRKWVQEYVLWPAAADIRENDPAPPDKVFEKLDSPGGADQGAGKGAARDTITLQRAALQPGALSRMPEPRAFLLRHKTRNGQPALIAEGDGFAAKGLPGVLTGEGGVGKSMLEIALGVSIPTGRPWLGFEVDSAHVGQRVLLVLAEETDAEVQRRLFEIAERWKLSEEERHQVEAKLFVLALAGKPCALASLTPDGALLPTGTFRELEALLRDSTEPWALVVLDPLARLFPGAERGNVEATFAVQAMERLATVPGSPLVLAAHHSSKIARRAGDVDARGVTGLADAARLVWSLKALKDGTVEFAQLKANYAPPMPKPLILRRDRGGLLRLATDAEIEAEAEAQVDAAAQEAAAEVDRVVAAVQAAPGGRVRTKAEIARRAKMKAGPARTAVDRAVEEGLLLLSGKGDERGYAVPPGAARQARSGRVGEENPPYPPDRGTAGPDADAGPSVRRSEGPGPGRDRGTALVENTPDTLSRSPNGSNAGPGDRDLRELIGQDVADGRSRRDEV